jgi:hypothetical protein
VSALTKLPLELTERVPDIHTEVLSVLPDDRLRVEMIGKEKLKALSFDAV